MIMKKKRNPEGAVPPSVLPLISETASDGLRLQERILGAGITVSAFRAEDLQSIMDAMRISFPPDAAPMAVSLTTVDPNSGRVRWLGTVCHDPGHPVSFVPALGLDPTMPTAAMLHGLHDAIVDHRSETANA